jgi:mannose-6-phosphate isomerase-like protein (cupin superfamily)
MSGEPPVLVDVAAAPCYRISAGDTVKLAVVRAPAAAGDASVLFEVWEPGGSQPPNSHPTSVETFWFLAGEGVATSDAVEVPVRAGTFLVLAPGSVHHIRNTGPGRLYAVTTMLPDAGFARLVAAGVPDRLDAADLAVVAGPA